MNAAPSPGPRRRVLAVHAGSQMYGSDRMFAESVRGFVENGDEVLVVLPDRGALCSLLDEAGVEVVVAAMPVLRKSALSLRGGAGLTAETVRSLGPGLRLARRFRPDVVYVSTVTIPSWFVIGRAVRARVVCHVHEAEPAAHRVVQTGLAAPLLLAHECLINSAFSAEVLTRALPALASRVTVVPNGVAGPTQEPAAVRGDPTPLRLLFVGRLSPRKGPDVAVRAVRELRDRGVDVQIRLVGSIFPGYEWFDESLRSENADLVDAGVLEFAGFTSDVWSALADCDIAVVPSVMAEPFGNAAVEAALAQRPVIVSDIGGLPEAVADMPSARRVEPGDPDAIAAAVDDVLQDWDDMAEQVQESRRIALARFGPTTYRRRIAALG